MMIRPIPNWAGYFASDEGDIYSDTGWRGSGLRKMQAHPKGTSSTYLQVRLTKAGRRRSVAVHRLVAAAFHGPCPEGYQCRHLDGDPLNNRPDNLRWGTPAENYADRAKHGRHFGPKFISNAILDEDKVRKIRRKYEAGAKQADLAREFGTTQGNISAVVRREHWAHVQ